MHEDSQQELYFAQFDELGETSVRVALGCGEWENSRTKQSFAQQWLHLKEESRMRFSLRLNIHIAIAAYIAAIAATIGAIIAIKSII